MAGWLAPPDVWDSFSAAWRGVLDKEEYRIQTFRMADYENQQQEFKKGWDDVHKRHRFLGELIKVIQHHELCGIGSVILMDDYEASPELKEERLDDAYFLNFQLCASDSVQIAGRKFNAAKVSFVFSTQGQYCGRLPALYESVRSWSNTIRFGPIAFDTPNGMMPLQAADVIAYEIYKLFYNRIYDPGRRKRWSYQQLAPLILGTTFVDKGKHDISGDKDSVVISRN